MKQGNIQIITEIITHQTRKVLNWMCPGQNGVKVYWLEKFSALHERMTPQMDDIINSTMDNPKWMTTGKAIVC